MRHTHTFGPFGIATLLWLFTAWIVAASTAWGQAFPPDPVDELRQLLKVHDRESPEFAQRFRKQIDSLTDLADLARALKLPEWEDADTDQALDPAGAGQAVVAERFEHAIRSQLRSSDRARRRAALELLVEMSNDHPTILIRCGAGPRLAQDLLSLIESGEPAVGEAAVRALGRVHPDPDRAVAALEHYAESKPGARKLAALTALADLVRGAALAIADKHSRERTPQARRELVQTAAVVVPVAGRWIADPDPAVRRQCLTVLRETAAVANQLISDPRWRPLQVETEDRPIANLSGDLVPLVQALKCQQRALVQAMDAADPVLRLQASQALEDLAAVLLATDVKQRAVSGSNYPARERPIQRTEYRTNGPGGETLPEDWQRTVSALASRVGDPNLQTRLGALDVLETLGPAAAPAVPALVRALNDPNRFVRWSAARTLGKIGPAELDRTIPGLERLLDDSDLDVRLAAAAALGRYGPAAAPAVKGLIRLLKAQDASLRLAGVRALRNIGRGAATAIPDLQKLLQDPDARLRLLAGELLARLAPAGPESVKVP
jgi:hypothetical protein